MADDGVLTTDPHILAIIAATLPPHLLEVFHAECAAHPGEVPRITRGVVEVYPDARAFSTRTRCYRPGVYYWEWADGTGFAPPPEGRA